MRLGSNPLTLAALLPFAENCADLVELGLVFDARGDPPVLPSRLSPSQSRVRTLAEVCDSPITQEVVGGVARFLATLFPQLRGVSSSASPYKKIWDAVSTRLEHGRLLAVDEPAPNKGGMRAGSGVEAGKVARTLSPR